MATARIVTSINAALGIAAQLSKQFDVTLTGEDWDAGTISVTTTDVQLTVKSTCATVGWMVLYNEDATNYVNFGKWNSGSGQTYHVRIPPATAVLLFSELAANDLSLKADTATCKVHFLVFER